MYLNSLKKITILLYVRNYVYISVKLEELINKRLGLNNIKWRMYTDSLANHNTCLLSWLDPGAGVDGVPVQQ